MRLTFFLDPGRIAVRVSSTSSPEEVDDGVALGDTGLRLVDTPFAAIGVVARPILAGGADAAAAIADLVLAC